MEPQLGADIAVYVERAAEEHLVAARRDVEVQRNLDLKPAVNPNEYGSEYHVAGLTSWAVSLSTLVLMGETEADIDAAHESLRTAQKNRETVSVRLSWPNGAEETGEAWVEGITESAQYDNLLTGNIQLVGQGELG